MAPSLPPTPSQKTGLIAIMIVSYSKNDELNLTFNQKISIICQFCVGVLVFKTYEMKKLEN